MFFTNLFSILDYPKTVLHGINVLENKKCLKSLNPPLVSNVYGLYVNF